MPTAASKSYSVTYVHLAALSDVLALANALLPLGFEVVLIARQDDQGIKHVTINVNKPGAPFGQLQTGLGRYVVYDTGSLHEMDEAEFTEKYTV